MGGRGGIEYAGMTLSWVTLLGVVVVGIFSLLSLYLGFEAYGSDRSERAIYYLLIGTAGFAAMGYMFFRAKAVAPIRPELPRLEVVTTLECPQCGLKKIKEFERGEFVFRDDIPCDRCEGRLVVTRIHRRKKAGAEKAAARP